MMHRLEDAILILGGCIMTHFTDIPIPRVMFVEEQKALLRTLRNRKDKIRDYVIFSLALDLALREFEIAALNVGDISDTSGNIFNVINLRVFKRGAKRPVSQSMLIPPDLRKILTQYLRWKKRKGESLAPDGPLFMSRKGNRLSKRQIRTLSRQWQERAGIRNPYTFHQLRHTSITDTYEDQNDIVQAKQHARHANISTTQIYTHARIENYARAVCTASRLRHS